MRPPEGLPAPGIHEEDRESDERDAEGNLMEVEGDRLLDSPVEPEGDGEAIGRDRPKSLLDEEEDRNHRRGHQHGLGDEKAIDTRAYPVEGDEQHQDRAEVVGQLI